MEHSPRFLALVNDAKTRIRERTAEQVKERMARDSNFELVDVREESEWNAGHIRGAKYLGRGVLERDVEKRFPDLEREIVLYCGGGFRSALAADNMQKMGYRNVWSMDGGWRRWKEIGGATE
jgi:rhodanese-related sulfurtransferase